MDDTNEQQRISLVGLRKGWLCCLLVVFLLNDVVALSYHNEGKNAIVIVRDPRWRHKHSHPTRSSLDLDLFLKIRGGEETEEISTESSSSSGVLTKVRNIIRSVLEIGDRKIPVLAKPLRSLIQSLEGILGVELLPKAPKKKKKSKKSKKGKKQRKTQGEAEEGGSEEEQVLKEKKKPKKASAATTKHLTDKISTTNPNYRIQKELKAFIKDPPPGLTVKVGKNIRVWIVTMEGAKNTIYEGEVWKLRISFPTQYPTMPPSVYFLPPNIP